MVAIWFSSGTLVVRVVFRRFGEEDEEGLEFMPRELAVAALSGGLGDVSVGALETRPIMKAEPQVMAQAAE